MKYQEGDHVMVIAKKHGHRLTIGSKAKIKTIDRLTNGGYSIQLDGGRQPWSCWVELCEICPVIRVYPHKDKELWTTTFKVGGVRYAMRWAGCTREKVEIIAREWAASIASL